MLLSEKPIDSNVRCHRHNIRPYRDPNAQPVKWVKLMQWWLVYRVSIDMIITPQIESAVCIRFKVPEWNWEEAKCLSPSEQDAVFRLNTADWFFSGLSLSKNAELDVPVWEEADATGWSQAVQALASSAF